MALAESTASFSPADQRRLLEVLAREAMVLNDRTLITDLWSRLARLEPDALEPQLRLFDLALQGKNKADVENRLNEIKRIDGSDGPNTKFGKARFTIWQAESTTDRSEQANLRESAEEQLRELMGRFTELPPIPRLLADLTMADLTQSGLSAEQKKSKANEAAELYLKAIELGQRDLDTLRKATDLLYFLERKADATKLWTELASPSTGWLRQAAAGAIRNNDKEGALELARKAKASNPKDFQASLLLAQTLAANQRHAEAETELRDSVAADRLDVERWSKLIQFQSSMKQWRRPRRRFKMPRQPSREIPWDPAGAARCWAKLTRIVAVMTRNPRSGSMKRVAGLPRLIMTSKKTSTCSASTSIS